MELNRCTCVCVAGIEVRFRGAARAKWNECVQNGPHRTDIEHEKEEIYFDDRFCLWGRGSERTHFNNVGVFCIVFFSLKI